MKGILHVILIAQDPPADAIDKPLDLLEQQGESLFVLNSAERRPEIG